MKKMVLTAAVTLAAVTGFAQSQDYVNFNNRVTAAGLYAPIYGVQSQWTTMEEARGNATTNGGTKVYTSPGLLGTGYTAALFGNVAGTPEGGLLFVTSAPFRTNAALAGIFNPAIAQWHIPNTGSFPGGRFAAIQIRAWDNRGGTITSWAAVMADATIPRGSSAILDNFQLPGDAAAANLIGLESFGLIIPVPEPSLIALGALGLGALLFRRRKA